MIVTAENNHDGTVTIVMDGDSETVSIEDAMEATATLAGFRMLSETKAQEEEFDRHIATITNAINDDESHRAFPGKDAQ